MYTFTDKGGERITLRPEATPSVVRAYVEHSLEQAMAVPKIYTIGPMFRHERPQKGRYRQFHQLDVEVFGVKDPSVDAEIIDLAWTLIATSESPGVELALNSVGCPACRPAFAAALVAALGEDVDKLCADCQRRVETNPLRIFDCKVPADQAIIDRAAAHRRTTCATSAGRTSTPCARYLDAGRVPYTLSHRLVRGLDYYTRTTFEVLAGRIGAQNAVLRRRPLRRPGQGPRRARSRGHRLRGRHRAPRAGAARGRSRCRAARPDVFVAALGDAGARGGARAGARAAARRPRRPVEYEGRSLKSQMKRADRLKAPLVLILGEDELARGEVTVKHMAASTQDRRGDAVVERAECAASLRASRSQADRICMADQLGDWTRTHTCGALARRHRPRGRCSAGCTACATTAALVFLDLRDRYGITQVVVPPRAQPWPRAPSALRAEFVVGVRGTVRGARGRRGQPEACRPARSRWPRPSSAC